MRGPVALQATLLFFLRLLAGPFLDRRLLQFIVAHSSEELELVVSVD